jgi:hypothetical protein
MARYLQKTESQEFEIPNLGQAPDQWKENIRSANGTDITVRVSRTGYLAESGPITWKADSALVYMIADIVAASGGSFAEELPGAMTAHFGSSPQALVAAKRIQVSVLEFRACRPNQGVAAAILIHSPITNHPLDSQRELEQVLGQASPGQILLEPGISAGLRNFPGAEFRASALQGALLGKPQAELMELIWTTANGRGYDSDQSAPLYVDQPSLIGATRIVNSPFRNVDNLENAVFEPLPIAPKEAVSVETKQHSGGPSIQFAAPTEESSVTRESEGTNTGNPLLLDELDESPKRRQLAILAVAAVVAVVAIVFVVRRPVSPTPSVIVDRSAPSGGNSNGTGTTTSGTPATNPSSVSDQSTPSQGNSSGTGTTTLGTSATTAKGGHSAGTKSKETTDPETESKRSIDGVSTKDIPGLLRLAQMDFNSGNYEKAEYDYNIVLKLQPGNPDAKQGLKKLSQIRNETNQ